MVADEQNRSVALERYNKFKDRWTSELNGFICTISTGRVGKSYYERLACKSIITVEHFVECKVINPEQS